MSEKVLLVVPCYNEERRLNLPEFERYARQGFRFLFVDDGSTDHTYGLISAWIQDCRLDGVQICKLERNMGKAEAVRRGMIKARDDSFSSDVQWIGFWDADLATPLREADRMLAYAREFYAEDVSAIFGCRVFRLGSTIRRSSFRHYVGRVFSTLAHFIVGIKSYDSQCGAKLFKRDLIGAAFGDHFVSRWIFDVELQKRVLGSGGTVIEYPVTHWEDVAGSKLKFKDGFVAFSDLLRIRKRYG